MSTPCSTRRPRAAYLWLALFGVAYPFVVYASLDRVSPSLFVGLAIAVLGVRVLLLRGERQGGTLALLLAGVALGLVALLWFDGRVAAKAYPVLMSLAFAAAFGLSLVFPPTVIERFATAAGTNMTPQTRLYMRRVTRVWFAFLLVNAMISGWTATIGDPAVWALYNGLVSYFLMGLLLGGELLVRRRVRRRAGDPAT